MRHSSVNDHHPLHIFWIFLRLGLTSFGGPIAHLGYFRDEFVNRRRWLTDHSYADVVALCQFLPGPASSQVGMALGLLRSGHAGALAAWAGFTLPSAIAMILFALGLEHYGNAIPGGLLHGLKVVAVAVVAQAVWGMARTICTDKARVTLMATAACIVLWFPSTFGQIAVILASALIGLIWFKPSVSVSHDPLPIAVSRKAAIFFLVVFVVLLLGLPLLNHIVDNQVLALFDTFYRTGALVFGGGHVVLPLLQAQVVPNGWVSNGIFLAGYGAAQAVPGPLFTFAAFLGSSVRLGLSGWWGGLTCLVAIFLPSYLLVTGVTPFWGDLRRRIHVQAALAGVNSAVVGLLLTALYRPIWTSAISKPADFGLALVALIALVTWKFPPWVVVVGCGALGWWLSPFA